MEPNQGGGDGGGGGVGARKAYRPCHSAFLYIFFIFLLYVFFLFIFLDLTVCGTVTTGWVGRWSVSVVCVGGGVVSHIVATVFGSALSSARPRSSLVAGNAATI